MSERVNRKDPQHRGGGKVGGLLCHYHVSEQRCPHSMFTTAQLALKELKARITAKMQPEGQQAPPLFYLQITLNKSYPH